MISLSQLVQFHVGQTHLLTQRHQRGDRFTPHATGHLNVQFIPFLRNGIQNGDAYLAHSRLFLQFRICLCQHKLNVLQCHIRLSLSQQLIFLGLRLLLVGDHSLTFCLVPLTASLIPLLLDVFLFVSNLYGLSRRHYPRPRGNQSCEEDKQASQSRGHGNARIAATPPPRSLQSTDRSRVNRFAVQISTQIVGHRRTAFVTTSRILLQSFQADGLQIQRNSRLQLPRSHRFVVDHLHHRFQRAIGNKWRTRCQHLIQNSTHRILIRFGCHRRDLSASLLRGHVTGTAHNGAVPSRC